MKATTPWVSPQAHARTEKVKWTDQPRPPLAKKLPRYTFNAEIGPGCAGHGRADCLCDVNVSTETPICTAPLLFAQIATEANGPPSRRNIVRWAETLLGCFETERRLVEREDTNGIYWRLPYATQNPNGWELLGPEVRDDLLWWTTQNVTFSKVKGLVPSHFTPAQRKNVRKLFNHHKTNHKQNRRKQQCSPTTTTRPKEQKK